MRQLGLAALRAGAVAGTGAALVALLGPAAKYPLQGVASAASYVYVAVVVDFGGLSGAPSQPVAKCVEVPSGSTMADALAAGFSPLGWASNGLLCQIEGYPTSEQVSNCDSYVNGKYQYWSFWTGTPSGTWSYAQLGPGGLSATQGSVEGYRFELSGAGNATDPPPAYPSNFSQICADAPPATAAPTTTTTTVATSAPGTTATTRTSGGGNGAHSVSATTTTSPSTPASTLAGGTTSPVYTTTSATVADSTTTSFGSHTKVIASGGGEAAKFEIGGVAALVLILAAGAALRFRKGASR